ncbi:NAD(P)-dependent oxidoreductase [Streptomyces sp. MBT53]|uniref:NAD(P)-dependent oxidoreductase n=1 Tax=Streptomyces sp. MBT53 TaxID=1488384 RepID=UPI0027D9F7DA|nr:NAD(P)-dependent oxidoreductase [Streptomyces sp. MBT53]
MPPSDTARHLVDHRFLAAVKPGAVLVNCGRGGLVGLDAVRDALLAGRLSGVGPDL